MDDVPHAPFTAELRRQPTIEEPGAPSGSQPTEQPAVPSGSHLPSEDAHMHDPEGGEQKNDEHEAPLVTHSMWEHLDEKAQKSLQRLTEDIITFFCRPVTRAVFSHLLSLTFHTKPWINTTGASVDQSFESLERPLEKH